ncbi:MAG: cytochrome c peroxidase, partial [Candidatus Hydrogenedentales bacterium]
MKWACAVSLAVVAVSARASEEAVPPIPGFRYDAGRYLPDEPWREGQPRVSGLQHPFPAMASLEENPVTPERVSLGKLLYFDPLLSGDNTISCAHCHHPDFGFSDGRTTSMGVGGVGVGPDRTGGQRLPRAAPTIWNAAYNHLQFWDGRAADLEDQADKPIRSNIEMNQDPNELVEELLDVPEYVALFDAAFDPLGADTVTYENVLKAIGAFERTLLSFNSRFDRYTQGDADALTDEEKRGLALFRSVKTRCFECHHMPTFADEAFRVIGVPNSRHDPGRAGVPGQGPDGGFKVPTLRNVALTAPYMHNGAFETLEEVIQFYADGAGRVEANPVPGIDDKIHKFPMTDWEVTDLAAFLRALTDTSLQPDAPARVPSGLPVVAVTSRAVPAPPPVQLARAENDQEAAANSEAGQPAIRPDVRGAFERRDAATSAAAVFTVSPGELIQAAIDRAEPGDRIE